MINNDRLTLNLNFKKLLIIIISLQLALFGLIALGKLGLKIPILRQVIGFIYLTFIPGFLILRLLRINSENPIITLLYSVGLSFSFLMFLGAFINFLYPLLGTSRPISENSLIITISIVVPLLCLTCYFRDKNYSASFSICTNLAFSTSVLALLLLPFLAIFGTYLLNFYDNNILLLILPPVISGVLELVVFNKLPREVYPLAIWTVAITLLFYSTLISQYILWGDFSYQYYIIESVIANGFWNAATPGDVNAMLSIVMLSPIFSIVSDINSMWLFKIVLPLWLSLIPVGLYEAYKRQTNTEFAFLSSFLLISAFPFFTWVSRNLQQGIAELFLMLLIVLMIDRNIARTQKTILAVIFAFSLITAHYAISYIFMLSLIFALFMLFLLRKQIRDQQFSHRSAIIVTPTFVTLYIVLALSWYMYITSGSTFQEFILIGSNVMNSITEFLNPEFSSGVYLFTRELPLSVEISRILYLLIIFFSAIGLLNLLRRHKVTKKFSIEYATLSIAFFGFLSATILPITSLDVTRVYHITSILLAPFSIIGGISSIKVLSKLFHKTLGNLQSPKVLSILLIIFLLFNTGWISEVVIKDYYLPAPWISKERILKDDILLYETVESKIYLCWYYISEYDVISTKWLSKYRDSTQKIYFTDVRSLPLFLSYGMMENFRAIPLRKDTEVDGGYIYLTYLSYVEGVVWSESHATRKLWYNTSQINSMLEEINKVYINRGSVIYQY